MIREKVIKHPDRAEATRIFSSPGTGPQRIAAAQVFDGRGPHVFPGRTAGSSRHEERPPRHRSSHRPSDRSSHRPRPSPVVPGTKDPQGRLIAATEANHLAAHRGQLFASFGATYRNPPTPDPDFQGFAVLRKETATGPWQVDLDLGPKPYRVEALTSLTFTTDANGRKLEQPVARLVAARWSQNQTILVREEGVFEPDFWTRTGTCGLPPTSEQALPPPR